MNIQKIKLLLICEYKVEKKGTEVHVRIDIHECVILNIKKSERTRAFTHKCEYEIAHSLIITLKSGKKDCGSS